MVTRNLYKVANLNRSEIYMVNGFLTAIIDFNVTTISGSRTFGIYGDVETVSSSSPRPTVWLNGKKQRNNIEISDTGNHRIVVDLVNVNNLLINIVNSEDFTFTGTCRIHFTPMSVDDYVKYQKAVNSFLEDYDNKTIVGGGYEEIYDVRGMKQLDISIKKLSQSVSSSNRYIRVYKSDDGSTWSNVNDFICDEFILSGGFVDVSSRDSLNLFANIENVRYIKVKIDTPVDDLFIISHELHDNYINRTFLLWLGNPAYTNLIKNNFKGYRYVKVGLYNQTTSSIGASIYVMGNPNVLNTNYEKIELPYADPFYSSSTNRTSFNILGTAVGGGVVLEFANTLTELRIFIGGTISGSLGSIYITLSNEKNKDK